MSTRSNIGIINPDGTVKMIYCHSDGYPSYNGALLLKHWSNTPFIMALLRLGDISSLGETLGEKHDFKNFDISWRNKWTKAYGRDRGETGVEARTYSNAQIALSNMEEYLYLWDDVNQTWLFSDHGGDFKPLTPAECKN